MVYKKYLNYRNIILVSFLVNKKSGDVMDCTNVKKHSGKKVLVILKNNYKYTITIPNFEGESFSTKDVFGKEISITCDFISAIIPLEGKQ